MAVRCWRGPDIVSPAQMQKVNVLCGYVAELSKHSPSMMVWGDKKDLHGRARVMRVNHEHVAVDMIWTWNPEYPGLILLKDEGTGIVYIYNTDGIEIKRIESNNTCGLYTADKDKIFMFCYTDYETVSYYCKFDYAGNLLYGQEFAAGVINAARGHSTYDLLMGWSSPAGLLDLPNTQWLWLYNNAVLVGSISFSVTASTRKYATDARITDQGVFLTIMDWYWNGDEWTKQEAFLQRYDFEMSLVSETLPNGLSPSSPFPQYPWSNEYYSTYSYVAGDPISKYIEKVKTDDLKLGDTPATSTFTLDYYMSIPDDLIWAPLGLIDFNYYWWWANMTNQTDGIIVYDVQGGSEKKRISLPACDWYLVGGGISLPYRKPGCVIKEAIGV